MIAAEILVVEHVEQLRDSGDLDSSEIEDLGQPEIDPVEGVAQDALAVEGLLAEGDVRGAHGIEQAAPARG